MGFWQDVNRRFGRSKLSELITRYTTNTPVLPDTTKHEYYIGNYTNNGDVFSIINKFTEPGSRVPIKQVDRKTGDDKPGKSLELLKKPNPFQSQTEFIEACLTFFAIFGNCYIAGERPEFGLRVGQITRLDILPPQWVEIITGTFDEPIKGYSLTEAYENAVDYEFAQVMHWKEFNPDFNINGRHLYGMSRLKPLLNATAASQSAYDSLVAAFQNQGAYGILSILGVKDGKGSYTGAPGDEEQLNRATRKWKRKWSGDAKRGDLALSNMEVKWTPFGLSVHDLSILQSMPISRGVIADAFNVPEVLLSNSQGRTYANYAEAMKSLWNNAIIPNVDGLLNKLNDWLLPALGEGDTMLVADYDEIPALQADKKTLVDWMTRAGYTFNEIRIATGAEPLNLPNMDTPLISFGLTPVEEIGMMPDNSEENLKRLKFKDYRE